MSHCNYCDADFVSGRPCRTIAKRNKCSEFAHYQMSRCPYWSGEKSLSEPDALPIIGEVRQSNKEI